ncbi:hypothetical protein BJF83_12495 [Nocardiopsis sp. CNR-923]|uniref:DUF2306 domain-containing protein n=1 Tax=Nocardiopsis sp. CNR-923 TaxID=1904965 RepID=UPI00096679DC|nr:DUF2306 domain-containing protein [Nocardiopsis sp. CNR-923]OLT29250.1 hypothetical protein BJF83_12495 [Nocardiopsis sp. CNR-923]
MTQPTAAPTPPDSRAPRPPRPWWRRPWIVPLALFGLVFAAYALPPYTSLDPEQARLPVRDDLAWHYPVLVTHIFAGALLTLIVPLQVWPWLRRRHPSVHRWSGRVYVLLGVPLVGVPGLLLGPLSSVGPDARISNVLWALLWLACTVLGYLAARRRDFARHRAWMLRSFVLLYGVALNRIVLVLLALLMLPWLDSGFGGDVEAMILSVAVSSSYLSWVLPLLAVEWWLGRRAPGRLRTTAR